MIRDFPAVVDALSSETGVTLGRMFGAAGLKAGKRVFAMEVKGELVVKLSPERAAELRALKLTRPFDPGHGRPMKQWLSIAPQAEVDWLELAREALLCVRG